MARLRKSRTDKMLTGVCGGIAYHFGWDATVVRLAFVIFAFLSFGTAIVLYFILAVIMPD